MHLVQIGETGIYFLISATAWEWELHVDEVHCSCTAAVCLGGNAERLYRVGALTLPRVPRSNTTAFPGTSQFFPQPRPCWEIKLPSHLATRRRKTSQCLEWPMAKLTDPQMAHLVRDRTRLWCFAWSCSYNAGHSVFWFYTLIHDQLSVQNSNINHSG